MNNIKIKLIKLFVFLIILNCFSINISAQAEFIKNEGQFEDNISFLLKHNAGNIYYEKNKVTYHLFQKDKLYKIKHQHSKNLKIKEHIYNTEFLEANKNCKIIGKSKMEKYHNYFLGNNSNKWKSNVAVFNKIKYQNVYKEIDVVYYEKNGHLKYDFVLHPNSNPQQIQIKYNGIDSIFVQSGYLVIATSLGNVIEKKPFAYQYLNGKKRKVNCEFHVRENIVEFKFPDGYNDSYELIIDPDIIFSTYSGSVSDNWGHTATYDNDGNLYAGSIAFEIGYPVTTGSFQSDFGGGNTDICISKFSNDGNNLIYSTYFGGNNNENPHSLIVNGNNELYIFGTTGSINFPVTENAYDNNFNGGDSWGFIVYGNDYYVPYQNGTDIVVSKFSSSGNNLLASTFIGGSKNDGINESGANYTFGLCNFYADEYRGEIIIDDNNNCYIASTTKSIDFPVLNSSQTSNNGEQDAVVFSLNEDLSEMRWSSYFGGSGNDAAYSIQLNSQNEIYITGGTMSDDLSTTQNVIHPNYNGGIDGFVSKYDPNFNNVAATYIGNSGYNQCYFVQIDLDDNVYVLGLTDQEIEIYPIDNYFITGSQFIQKLNSELDSLMISSSFGNGVIEKNITPTAFLVSDCGLIYVCGWGGGQNPSNGTTSNLPITDDAYQNTTDNSDIYLAVFEENMQSLIYGTYFGGDQSNEHVDGGTSRFDKNGKVYQAVCAGCGGNSDFPTTPGVVSLENESSNCNLGAFKFSLRTISSVISVPNFYACLPYEYEFDSESEGGNTYYWDFGDGNYSYYEDPSHTYSDTGDYVIKLIVSDSNFCVNPDSTFINIKVYGTENAQVTGNNTICNDQTTELTAHGGNQYSWNPTNGLSSGSSKVVTASPNNTTTYELVATDSCGSDTTYFTVEIFDPPFVNAGNDVWINHGETISLFGNVTSDNFYWESSGELSCNDCINPEISPLENTIYKLYVTDENGCKNSDSVMVNMKGNLFVPNSFTPNDDGNNDYFEVKGEQIKDYKIWIFNRWGQLVFYNSDISKSWDGYFRNLPAEVGGYVWEIEYMDYSEEKKKLNGHLNLLR